VVLHEAGGESLLGDISDGRLDIVGVVDGTAGNLCRPAFPVPSVSKPRQALVNDRALDFGGAPSYAAISRDIDFGDRAVA